MVYVDTSVLIAALTGEADASTVWIWLAQRKTGELYVSLWTDAEIASALSKKVRMGALNAAQQREALSEWALLKLESLFVLEVTSGHFARAAMIAGRPELNARSADALHLAIASDHGLSLASLDRRMGEAAPLLGITLETLT